MKLRLLWALALTVGLTTFASAAPKIAGKAKYAPHELVRLKAEGVDPKDAILWRITPSKGTWRATTAKDLCEFSAMPGTFDVLMIVISKTDSAFDVNEANITIEVEGCSGLSPAPLPPKEDPKDGKHDPMGAIGRVRFGNAGCTASAIHPRRPDGRWDILCAAHCVSQVGQRGTFTLKDGRVIGVRVAAMDKTNDCAWFVTEESVDNMPYAKLAKANPAVGVKVWHAGFGIDNPGNREDGEVQTSEEPDGKSRFLLSVSSGDSGGPIFRSDTNEVVSSACCTMERGQKVSMWGTSAVSANKLRPKLTSAEADEWAPTLMPVVGSQLKVKESESWKPLIMPLKGDHTNTETAPKPRPFSSRSK